MLVFKPCKGNVTAATGEGNSAAPRTAVNRTNSVWQAPHLMQFMGCPSRSQHVGLSGLLENHIQFFRTIHFIGLPQKKQR